MSQRSYRLEVVGKSVTGNVDHAKPAESHPAGAVKSSKAPLAVIGASIAAHKNTQAESAVGPTQQARAPRASSASHTPAGEKLKRSAGTATSSNAIELSLVRNLKQQIACLEAQLRVARQQHDAAARSHPRRCSRTDGDAGALSGADATAREEDKERHAKGVALPLPHRERVHHVDAVVGAHKGAALDGEDDVHRLRRIPDGYQIERAALQYNVESLTKDIEGLQSLALQVGRERDVMAAEVVQFRAALRESRVEHDAMASECAATLQLLEAERALRRAAEEDVAAAYARGGPAPAASAVVSSGADTATADAESQRNYYKLQSDRLKASVAREKARAESLAAALLEERGRAASLEKQLCGALDRVELMETREGQLAAYYQSLGARFVTLSAMLRHVLHIVPEDLLRQSSPAQPECDGFAVDDDKTMTLGEVRETLTAWQADVLSSAVQLKALVPDEAAATAPPGSSGAKGDMPPAALNTAVPAIVVAPVLTPPPERALDAQTPPLPLALTSATPTPALEGREDSAVATSAGNASVTSAPDIMAVATVATVTRLAVEQPEVLKAFEKPEKGLLAAAQEFDDASVSADPLAGLPPPAVAVTAEEPADAVAGAADDANDAAAGDARMGTPVAIPPALYNWASVSEVAPSKSEREGEGAEGGAAVAQSAAHNAEREGDENDVPAMEAEGSSDPVTGAAASETAAEDKPDVPPEPPAAPFDCFTEVAKGESSLPLGAVAPPAAEATAAGTASPLNVPSLATAPESSPEESDAEGETAAAAARGEEGATEIPPPPPPPSAEAETAAEVPSALAAEVEEADDITPVPAAAEEAAPAVGVVSAVSPLVEPASAAASLIEDADVVDVAEASAAPEVAPAMPAPAVPPPPIVAVAPPPPPSAFVPPPPPPTFSVPLPQSIVPPPPPGGVSVPAPLPPPPPAAVVPVSGPPTAPTPPTLEEQLASLDARIEAQNASLADLVQRHKDAA